MAGTTPVVTDVGVSVEVASNTAALLKGYTEFAVVGVV
jgi:hypothetical protein